MRYELNVAHFDAVSSFTQTYILYLLQYLFPTAYKSITYYQMSSFGKGNQWANNNVIKFCKYINNIII